MISHLMHFKKRENVKFAVSAEYDAEYEKTPA